MNARERTRRILPRVSMEASDAASAASFSPLLSKHFTIDSNRASPLRKPSHDAKSGLSLLHFQIRESPQVPCTHVGDGPEFESIAIPM